MRSAEELQLTSALWILTSFATMCQLISASPLERETERERERERVCARALNFPLNKIKRSISSPSITGLCVCVCVCVHAEFSFKQNMMFNQFSINYWVKQKLSQMYILHLYESYDFIFFKKELSLTGD